MTGDADRQLLLRLARESIAAHVRRLARPSPEPVGVFARRGGAFVSLHVERSLRGCIGHVEMDDPLGEVIPHCAIGACSHDPRFPRVTEGELGDLDVEISLLTPFEPIADTADIEIGRHGLLVERGWHRGLLLPQVATEWRWDTDAFLAHTCRKAGLAADAWKNGARLFRFEAEVFADR